MFRAGEKSVSAAHDKGVACWGIPYDSLLEMRREQVPFVGVYMRDDHEIYAAKREDFFDPKRTVPSYAERGPMKQMLPLGYFVKISL